MGWSRRGVGLTYYDPGRAYPGYTLLTVSGGDKVYLIDLEGSIVHQWHYAHGFGECHLLPMQASRISTYGIRDARN